VFGCDGALKDNGTDSLTVAARYNLCPFRAATVRESVPVLKGQDLFTLRIEIDPAFLHV
jgi:hypothetical protein